MSRPTRPIPLLAVLLALVLGPLTGCVSLPSSGPIVDADSSSVVDTDRPSDINAVPPAAGATAAEIVEGFLYVMTASPIRLDVARQYLTEEAAAAWTPEDATIVYGGRLETRDEGTRIEVPLIDADRLDQRRAWQGAVPTDDATLEFDVTVDPATNEWRITNPVDALVVPATWFSQRFRQASVYYFDPSGRILVPEPVYVPRGEQLASGLVASLVAGTPDSTGRVTRSFLPLGLDAGLSVPISPDGVADVSLTGEAGAIPPESAERMLAQLAWTLRQEPGIRAVRLTIGDQVVRVPSMTGEEYDVSLADVYDPNGIDASTEVFAVDGGLVRRREGNELVPVSGPLGAQRRPLRWAAVDLGADRAAAVSRGGTRLLVAPMDPDTTADDVRRPIAGATELLRPAWDVAGRVWTVDRTAEGAQVAYVDDRGTHAVTVPGITGRTVQAFLVSRDGTRLVAVVRGPRSDRLLVARVVVEPGGAVAPTTRPATAAADPALDARIVDLGWTSPTTVALATPVVPGEVFEVRGISIDGSPYGLDTFATTVPSDVVGLATSPVPELPAYAVAGSTLVDLATGASYGFVEGGGDSFGYVG